MTFLAGTKAGPQCKGFALLPRSVLLSLQQRPLNQPDRTVHGEHKGLFGGSEQPSLGQRNLRGAEGSQTLVWVDWFNMRRLPGPIKEITIGPAKAAHRS